MARPQFVQARPTVLDVSISDTENTEIVLQKLVAVGNIPLAMSDFGEILELTFNPGGKNEEIVSCTDFTVADDGKVTINENILRARSGKTPYTSGGVAFAHAAGTTVIVSNNAQMYDRILTYAEGMANAGAADASLTGKGLVEVATTAEINSGTELGATGALLAVNPFYLATSNYATRLPSAAEKLKLAEILGVSFFAGDGSDGALNVTSGTYTIDLSVKTVWQFSSVTIALGATLNFSGGTAGDKVPVIKCKGNFVNAGTITTVGLGVIGGVGGASCSGTSCTATSGTNGTQTVFPFVDGTIPARGLLGTGGTGQSAVPSGGSGGVGGALASKNSAYFYPYAINGSGGGGGGGGANSSVGTPGNGSAGGAGSLGLVLEIGGDFTNSGTINLNGQAGTAGVNGAGNGSNSWASGAGGGGGGGGAGSLILRYQGTFTNSGSITASGGASGPGGSIVSTGGGGGSPRYGSGGGGGSGGASAFNNGTAGGDGVGASASPAGGAGGVGGAGIIFMEKVTS